MPRGNPTVVVRVPADLVDEIAGLVGKRGVAAWIADTCRASLPGNVAPKKRRGPRRAADPVPVAPAGSLTEVPAALVGPACAHEWLKLPYITRCTLCGAVR